MMMSEPEASHAIVEFDRVSYEIGGVRPLVSELNLAVREGESLMLLGRSGSGKTTTLRLINRLLDATRGEVRVEGRRTTQWDVIRLRRRIGYVIQEIGLFPHLNVERNVGMIPTLEEWEPERVARRVEELLDLVGLPHGEFARRYPHELSGGQRQRVGVARALAADPPILLLDEPFGALDPITRAEMQRQFLSLQKRLKKTVVFVTHDVREAFLLGSRVALLQEGKLVAEGTPEELQRSTHPEAQIFLDCLNEKTTGQA